MNAYDNQGFSSLFDLTTELEMYSAKLLIQEEPDTRLLTANDLEAARTRTNPQSMQGGLPYRWSPFASGRILRYILRRVAFEKMFALNGVPGRRGAETAAT